MKNSYSIGVLVMRVVVLLSVAFLIFVTFGCLDKDALRAGYLNDGLAERSVGQAVFTGTVAQEEMMRAVAQIIGPQLQVSVEQETTDLSFACDAISSGLADIALVNLDQDESLEDLTETSLKLADDGVKFIANPALENFNDISEEDIRVLANREEDYFEETLTFFACNNDSHDWQFLLQVYDINPLGPSGNVLEVERDPQTVAADNAEVVQRVLADPKAIGMVSLNADVGDALVFMVEGLRPDDESYSLAMPLMLVWREPQNEVAQAVIQFFESKQGKQLLSDMQQKQ